MVTYTRYWRSSTSTMHPAGWAPRKTAQLLDETSASSSFNAFNATLVFEVAEFRIERINENDYVTFKYRITPDEDNSETCVGAAIKEGTGGIYNDVSVNTWNRYVTTLHPHDYASQQLQLYLDIAYIYRQTADYIGGVMPVSVTIPPVIKINPVEIVYDNPVRLTADGVNSQSIVVSNPETIGVKITGPNPPQPTAIYNVYSSSEVSFSTSFTYDSSLIGSQNLIINYTNLPVKQTFPGDQYTEAEYVWYYWEDSRNNYVARCGNYSWGTTINLAFVVEDNSDILQLISCSLVAVNNSTDEVMNMFLTSLSKMKLSYSFKYTASGNATFTVTLTTGTERLLEETFTGVAGTYNRELESEVLQQARLMNPILTIKDNYGRTITYDFGAVRVWRYDRPYLSIFDGYWSDPNGTMNLQSAHVALAATFEYSDLDGANVLTQKLEFFDYSDTEYSNPLVTINNPGLVSGQRKYFTNTLSTSIHYVVRLTITDSFGANSRKVVDLNRTGNVVMDFGNQGFGLAIGKLNEEAALEVNFPTVFYNEVTYPNGARQRTDAANVLGCMDTYGVGATTIQDMLDYLVNKVLNP